MTDASKLEGAALDEAVSRADGCAPGVVLPFSTEWEWGGLIIERERIGLYWIADESQWRAGLDMHPYTPEFDRAQAHGPTPLIAAMRAFVDSRQRLPLSVIDAAADRTRAAGTEPLNVAFLASKGEAP